MASFVYTVLRFEWDPAKAAANLAKHGVAFEEAASVFADGNGLDAADAAHSGEELRRLRMAVVVPWAPARRRLHDKEEVR